MSAQSSSSSPPRRSRPPPHIPSPYVSPSFSAASHALQLIDNASSPSSSTSDSPTGDIQATLSQLRTLRDHIWSHLHSTSPSWNVLTPAIASLHHALATTQTVSHLKHTVSPSSPLTNTANHSHIASVVQSTAQLAANVDLASAVREFAHLLRAAHINSKQTDPAHQQQHKQQQRHTITSNTNSNMKSIGEEEKEGENALALPKRFLHRAAAIHRAVVAASNPPLSKLNVLDGARDKLAREHAALQLRLENALRNGVFVSEVRTSRGDTHDSPISPQGRADGKDSEIDDGNELTQQPQPQSPLDEKDNIRTPLPSSIGTTGQDVIPSDALPAIVQAVDLLGGPNHAAHVLRQAASSRLSNLVRDAIINSSSSSSDTHTRDNPIRTYPTTWYARKPDNVPPERRSTFEGDCSRAQRVACAAVFDAVCHDMTAVLRRLSGLAEAVEQDGDMGDAVGHIWGCMERTLVSFMDAVLDMPQKQQQQSTCPSPRICSSPSSSSQSPGMSPPSSSPSSFSFASSHVPTLTRLPPPPPPPPLHSSDAWHAQDGSRTVTKTKGATTTPARISLLPSAASAARLKAIHAIGQRKLTDDVTSITHPSGTSRVATNHHQSKNTSWELGQTHASSVDSLICLLVNAADFSPSIYNLEVAYTPLQQFILTSTRLRHAWREPVTGSDGSAGVQSRRKRRMKKLFSSSPNNNNILLSDTLARAVELFIRTMQHDVHVHVRDTVLGKRVGALLKFQRRWNRPSSVSTTATTSHHHHSQQQRPFSSDRYALGNNEATTNMVKSTSLPETRMLINVIATCLRVAAAIPSIAVGVGDIIDRSVLTPFCLRAVDALNLVSGWSDGGILFDEMKRTVDNDNTLDDDEHENNEIDIDVDVDITSGQDVDRFEDDESTTQPRRKIITGDILHPYDDDHNIYTTNNIPHYSHVPSLRIRGVQGLATTCLNALCERDSKRIRETRVLLGNEWDAIVRLVSNAKLLIRELQECVSGHAVATTMQAGSGDTNSRPQTTQRFRRQYNNQDDYHVHDEGDTSIKSANANTGEEVDDNNGNKKSEENEEETPTQGNESNQQKPSARQRLSGNAPEASLCDLLRREGVILGSNGIHAPVLDAIRRVQPACRRLREDVIDRGLVLLHCEVVLQSFARVVAALSSTVMDDLEKRMSSSSSSPGRNVGESHMNVSSADRFMQSTGIGQSSTDRHTQRRQSPTNSKSTENDSHKSHMLPSSSSSASAHHEEKGQDRDRMLPGHDARDRTQDQDQGASDDDEGEGHDMNEFDEFGDRITHGNDESEEPIVTTMPSKTSSSSVDQGAIASHDKTKSGNLNDDNTNSFGHGHSLTKNSRLDTISLSVPHRPSLSNTRTRNRAVSSLETSCNNIHQHQHQRHPLSSSDIRQPPPPRWRSVPPTSSPASRSLHHHHRHSDQKAARHGRAFGDVVKAMDVFARAHIGKADTHFVLAGADHAVALAIKLGADRERAIAARLFLDSAAAIAADTLGWPGVESDYSVAEGASQSAAECRALLFAAGLL